jgi:hypothetical protein
MNNTPRPPAMLSLEQAVDAAPSLAALQQRVRESQRYLDLVRPLMPTTLHPHVQAGPLQGAEWCLLVASAAASTKLRHLMPALQRVLAQNGAQISSIRIRVQARER